MEGSVSMCKCGITITMTSGNVNNLSMVDVVAMRTILRLFKHVYMPARNTMGGHAGTLTLPIVVAFQTARGPWAASHCNVQ